MEKELIQYFDDITCWRPKTIPHSGFKVVYLVQMLYYGNGNTEGVELAYGRYKLAIDRIESEFSSDMNLHGSMQLTRATLTILTFNDGKFVGAEKLFDREQSFYETRFQHRNSQKYCVLEDYFNNGYTRI